MKKSPGLCVSVMLEFFVRKDKQEFSTLAVLLPNKTLSFA